MSSKHFIPLGYTLLIQPDPVDEKIGSIVVVKETRESDMNARMTGEVLAISDAAFAGDHEINKGKVAVGDRVLYRRYSGVKVEDRTDEIEQPRVLINDIDILAKMIDDE